METVTITGLTELGKALEALPKVIARRYLRRGIMAGLEPMKEDARNRAPVLKEPDARRIAGALRDAIIIWRDRDTNEHSSRYFITVRKIKLNRAQKRVIRILNRAGKSIDIIGDAYYGKYVEFGTARMPAQPFMRPAFEAGKQGAVQRFADTMRDALPDVVNEAKS